MQATDRGPLLRVVWTDEETEASGFLVIDQLIAGIATGGTRMRAGCTLDEVTDLAREMSLKTAIFGLPVGGAKGGIDYDPGAPDADAVRLRFVQAMRPYLEGTWVTAGDLGTSQPSLDRTFARAGIDDTTLHAALSRFEHPERVRERVTRAFSEVVDGFHMPDLIGGFGVAEAALAGLEQTGTPPGEARAVVQGFGAMGGSSARYLARAGVTVVAIVDSHGMVANTGRGLDVEALLRSRSPDGVVDRSVLRPDDRQLPGEEWLSIDAEVLVPAATSYVITADNCDDVAARLVVEAANVPLTETAEARLRNRDIPVIPAFVANAGAAAWAWWVLLDGVSDPSTAFRRLSADIRPLVAQMIAEYVADATSPREVALRLATTRRAGLRSEFGGVIPTRPLADPGSLAPGGEPPDQQPAVASGT